MGDKVDGIENRLVTSWHDRDGFMLRDKDEVNGTMTRIGRGGW